MRQMNWTWTTHANYVRMVNDECLRLKLLDWTTPVPFRGPLDRFRWRATASYFMCWYTMQVNISRALSYYYYFYTRACARVHRCVRMCIFFFFRLYCQNSYTKSGVGRLPSIEKVFFRE